MNAKSSTRLRLERLETRNMLSAMDIPFALPMALPRLPAVPGEYSRIGGHPITQAVLQDAVQNVAAMPNANPTLLPDQLTRAHSDSSNAEIELPANPTLTSDLLSPGLDISSYAQPAARGGVRDTVPRDQFPQFGQPTSDTALLSDSTPDTATGLADSGVVAVQILSVTSLVVVVYATDGQPNVATSGEMPDTAGFVPGPEMTGLDRQPLHDAASGLSDPTDLVPESPLQQGFPGGFGLDAPPAFDPAAPLYESGDVLASVEISPVSHGSAGFRGLPSHSFEMAAQPSFDSNLASSVEVSPPPVKSNARIRPRCMIWAASATRRLRPKRLCRWLPALRIRLRTTMWLSRTPRFRFPRRAGLLPSTRRLPPRCGLEAHRRTTRASKTRQALSSIWAIG